MTFLDELDELLNNFPKIEIMDGVLLNVSAKMKEMGLDPTLIICVSDKEK